MWFKLLTKQKTVNNFLYPSVRFIQVKRSIVHQIQDEPMYVKMKKKKEEEEEEQEQEELKEEQEEEQEEEQRRRTRTR